MAHHLATALRGQVHEDIVDAVVAAWLPGAHILDQSDYSGKVEGYVDHQSVYALPRSWTGAGVDREFFDDFRSFLMREDVVILGGNDNDDETHPLGNGQELPIERDAYGLNSVARKDPKFGFWTVFDRSTGTKVRFSFDDPFSKTTAKKASAPELVDIKITDFCPYDCAFCYQGSTRSGKHAEISPYDLARMLGEMRVFEAALGGGETTLHPKFVEYLTSLRREGVVPNFTTKSLAWLRDATVWPRVIEAIGAFAYSVDTEDDVRKLVTLLDANAISRDKASVQYVMGSSSIYTFESVIEAAAKERLRITLLGFKMTGRGALFKPVKYDGWLDVVKKIRDKHYGSIGIDTALALESEDALAKSKIARTLFSTKEGAFSMYIDAVDMKIGPSSYVPDMAMRRVSKLDRKTILDAFVGYAGEA